MPVSEQDQKADDKALIERVSKSIEERERLIAAFIAAYQRGAEERQAVIVAWLRDVAEKFGYPRITSREYFITQAYKDAAHHIEANAHMEKREPTRSPTEAPEIVPEQP